MPKFNFRPLILIASACVVYGYLMKPLGLVLATARAGLHQRLRRPRVQVERSDDPLRRPDRVLGPGVREGPDAAVPDLPGVHGNLPDPLGSRDGNLQQPDPRLLASRSRRSTCSTALIGVHARHADRRAARHRPGGDHRDAAADHLQPEPGGGAHHARRHLLRRAVRRLDHRDPGQPAGRVGLGGHLPRRLPDGAPGARRAGARHRRASARSSPAASPRW